MWRRSIEEETPQAAKRDVPDALSLTRAASKVDNQPNSLLQPIVRRHTVTDRRVAIDAREKVLNTNKYEQIRF